MSAGAVLVLSALAIVAFWIWQRSSKVRRRAELEQLGLRAERGLTAAVLAHEIRNPLAALRFQLHSLRNNAADGARVASTADTIDGELLRIQQLVTDYLEHERARSMRVQPVELADAARKLQVLLQELFRQGDTQLSVVAPPEAVTVTCDPHALRQILMNLVLNAHEAIKSRGSRRTAGSIVLRIGSADGFGTIDVADNGPGIPPEMRERLFKPFQTTKREGHGIGLALVKRFVDNYGGSVNVDSELNHGTTFHLRLPLAGDETEHLPAGGPAEPAEEAAQV
jgi:signal transduction histidine kinase